MIPGDSAYSFNSQDIGAFFRSMENTDTPFLEEMRRLQRKAAKELEDALIYGKDHEDFDIVIVPGGGRWLSRDRGWIEW